MILLSPRFVCLVCLITHTIAILHLAPVVYMAAHTHVHTCVRTHTHMNASTLTLFRVAAHMQQQQQQ